MKKVFSIILSFALSAALLTTAFAGFTDTVGHRYEDEIAYSQMKGYVTGINETTYNPDAPMSRAQLAVVWARFNLLKSANPKFTDLTTLTKYYDTAALLMYGLGIMKGTSDTTFSPDNSMTREQLIAIAMRDITGNAVTPTPTDADTLNGAYTDADQISGWAAAAVAAAVSSGLLSELYDGDTLEPQKAVTRAEVTKLLYNIDKPSHTVTIDPGITGGTITADPMTAKVGTTINLTITPDTGKHLKADSLKANNTVITGTSFTMPKRDVLITAEFEVTVESIAVKTMPNKTTYTVGDQLDLTGLVIEATMSDASIVPVTEYTTDPAAGATLDTEGTITVTVTYRTKTATFDVTVSAATAPDL